MPACVEVAAALQSMASVTQSVLPHAFVERLRRFLRHDAEREQALLNHSCGVAQQLLKRRIHGPPAVELNVVTGYPSTVLPAVPPG